MILVERVGWGFRGLLKGIRLFVSSQRIKERVLGQEEFMCQDLAPGICAESLRSSATIESPWNLISNLSVHLFSKLKMCSFTMFLR